MDSGTAKKLQLFAGCANKNTGAGHPNDHQRWIDFLISAHSNSADLDHSTLEEWLMTDGGFPSDAATDLAIYYERARAIMKTYDKFLAR